MKKIFAYLIPVVMWTCTDNMEPVIDIVEEEPREVLEQPISLLDYSSIGNWAFHPDQVVNLISNYDLDIGLVDKDLALIGSIPIANNAKINTGVDVFFVHPTLLDGIATAPELIPLDEQPTSRIDLTIVAQAGQFAKYGRIFSPRYRQSTGPTYLQDGVDKTVQANIIMQSYSDIKAAFVEYLNNYNRGNKIILAGHSQGSYLIAMLLRDLFDNDVQMRDKLVTAVLAGMVNVYADEGNYAGGQFENIPLCREVDECGCIQNWASFKEGQPINFFTTDLPWFNEEFVRYGVINRTIDLQTDWFVMDEAYIPDTLTSFRYIVLGGNVNANYGFNYIGHDNLYVARMRRDSNNQIGLNVAFMPEEGDLRINDLAIEEQHPLFDFWGYHTKDYATYLWPLLVQIDAKLANCN
ncbi:hypothetical protein MTsPCn5_01740 [Croceitalea sp. MTPC5]|uniref:DUF3089 domain-containing protein n=1 Tax=Croceitalea sp. MTPC5 TaxID=3056565 RepID=UPI002B3CBE6D|nr:hypothetical protein MTsPCn5_01740 [Croceitalea sp. MTPC5]